MGSSSLDSTSTQACLARAFSTRHWPRPTRPNIGLGPIVWISARVRSTQYRTRKTRLYIGLRRLRLNIDHLAQLGQGWLDSTLARNDLARLWPLPTRFDLGPYRLDSTWAQMTQLDVDLGRLCSTWVLSWLNLDWAKSKSNPKCNLDNPKLYPIKWIGFKIQKYRFGFEINPFKWIKTNINLNNYELNFVI